MPKLNFAVDSKGSSFVKDFKVMHARTRADKIGSA